MSRHRDVRCMNYSDEYDGYDDVYGHSVEDDYCVSPGAEQFMFDRNKQPNIASFFTEPDIVEDEEEIKESPSSYKVPELSELDAAKLISCVESIKNVVGDTYPESELNKKIIEFNYNSEAALNSILNDQTPKQDNQKEKQPLISKEPCEKNTGFIPQKLSNNKNSSPISSIFNTNLEEKHASTSKINSDHKQFSSLFDLINADSGLNLKKNVKNDVSKSKDQSQEYSSLFDMANSQIKESSIKKEISENSSSFGCLADLTAHHLQTSCSTEKPSGFVIPKFNMNSLNKNSSTKNNEINNSLIPDFGALSIALNITALKCSNANSRDIQTNKVTKSSINNQPKKVDHNILLPSQMIKNKECDIFGKQRQNHLSLKQSQKSLSLFGKILCKKWKRKSLRKNIYHLCDTDVQKIARFDFSSPSPDTKILSRILQKTSLK